MWVPKDIKHWLEHPEEYEKTNPLLDCTRKDIRVGDRVFAVYRHKEGPQQLVPAVVKEVKTHRKNGEELRLPKVVVEARDAKGKPIVFGISHWTCFERIGIVSRADDISEDTSMKSREEIIEEAEECIEEVLEKTYGEDWKQIDPETIMHNPSDYNIGRLYALAEMIFALKGEPNRNGEWIHMIVSIEG